MFMESNGGGFAFKYGLDEHPPLGELLLGVSTTLCKPLLTNLSTDIVRYALIEIYGKLSQYDRPVSNPGCPLFCYINRRQV